MNKRKTTDITVDDLSFEVEVLGPEDGTPVVLLHGWPQDGRSWRAVAANLVDQGLRVIVPNQRGYSPGARPDGVENYHTDVLARDVVAIAEACGHERFHLVGHDWGAAVSWIVATQHADRVLSLTAVSVPHLAAYNEALSVDEDAQKRADYIGLLRRPGKAEEVMLDDDAVRIRAMYGGDVDPADVEDYVELFSQPGALTATLNWYRAMGAELASTPDVTVPTTFIWGANDLAIGRYGAERCADHVTGEYRFVEVDGGHWLPDTHPDLVTEEILRRIRG